MPKYGKKSVTKKYNKKYNRKSNYKRKSYTKRRSGGSRSVVKSRTKSTAAKVMCVKGLEKGTYSLFTKKAKPTMSDKAM